MTLETVKTLSKKINIPEYTLRKLCRERQIPAYLVGRKYMFDIEEVILVIKKNRVR